mmetsp:Transcript_3863/g.10082  ORF Transcript_3863/g.10082 Transcript_3863/m.10082 type:complete len:280 (-) Transcript_3863:826-1665(-)
MRGRGGASALWSTGALFCSPHPTPQRWRLLHMAPTCTAGPRNPPIARGSLAGEPPAVLAASRGDSLGELLLGFLDSGRDVQDAHGPLLDVVGIAHRVHADDRVAIDEEPHLLALIKRQPHVRTVAALHIRLDGLGVAQVALNLAGHPSLGADGQDRRHRVELGQEARRLAGLGEHDDGLGLDVTGSLDSRRGRRLGVRERALVDAHRLHELEDLVVAALIGLTEHLLGLQARARHDLDGTLGEGAVGRLAGKHDGVCAVEHGVSHVGTLGARGARVDDH